jgi:16S rRNA (guanine(966)-N(2))-methyltransferase RsmD
VARGRRLKVPRGPALRPTADRVREALFDILGTRVKGACFLDAYAGTGAVGCEALSRGADRVVFVERDRRALRLIEDNLKIGPWAGAGEVVEGDARDSLRDLERGGKRFDIVFLDPPYDDPALAEVMVLGARLLRPGGALVVEHRSSRTIEAPAESRAPLPRSYRYGDTTLTVCRVPEDSRRA